MYLVQIIRGMRRQMVCGQNDTQNIYMPKNYYARYEVFDMATVVAMFIFRFEFWRENVVETK